MLFFKDRKFFILAALLSLIGLSVTLVTANFLRNEAIRDTISVFSQTSDQLTQKIIERVQAYELIIRGGAGLFSVNMDVSRDGWASYTGKLEPLETIPEVLGIGYAKLITPSELTSHIEQVQNEGFPDYSVWPEGSRAIYTSIIYLEPFDNRNMRAFGYDMFTEPVRREAMTRARDSGNASLSGKVLLVQENGDDLQAGILLYVPVYTNGMPLETVEQRQVALAGWSYSPYRMDDLMSGILEESQDLYGDIQIYDNKQISSESILYNSIGTNDTGLNVSYSPLFQQREVSMGGREWLITFDNPLSYENINQNLAWVVLISGGLITALLVAVIKVIDINSAYELTQKINKSTRELKAALDQVPELIFIKNTNMQYEYVNNSVKKFFNIKSKDIIGNKILKGRMFTKSSLEKIHYADLKSLSGQVEEIEIETKDNNKNKVIFKSTKRPIYDTIKGKKDIIGLLITWVDITDEKENEIQKAVYEKRLLESEQRFDTIIEQSFVGSFIIQNDVVVYANPRACEILGCESKDDLLKLNLIDLVEGSLEKEIFVAHIKDAYSGSMRGKGNDFFTKIKNKKGSLIDIGINFSFGSYHNAPAIICQIQDISGKKVAQEHISRYAQQLETVFMETVEMATALSELRDPYTSGHEKRVAKLALAIGVNLGLERYQLDGLKVASFLHDIEKITVPNDILTKPSKLSKLEFELVKTHVQAGYDILNKVEFPWPVSKIVLQHHERLDGSGYPNGILGDDIYLESRILMVADVVESMSSHRPYRPALGTEQALEEIKFGAGALYDQKVVSSCIEVFRNGFQFPS